MAVGEPGLAQHADEARGGRQVGHRAREVPVGLAIGEHPADQRHDPVEVHAMPGAEQRMLGLGGLEEGDAHIIRNAGGVVTDDVIRSLAISQRLLGTREIMLIHHTDCGMLTFKDDDLKAQIERETGIRPSFAFEAFENLEEDVRQSIRRIKASPFIPYKDNVRGFIYDVKTGRLREVLP